MAGEEMSREAKKGATFEQDVCSHMSEALNDGRIERRAKNGSKDRGDVTGVFLKGRRVVIECKNHRQMRLAEWCDEAEAEAGNDDAEFWFVVHHRKGCGRKNIGKSYVTTDLDTFEAVIAGSRDYLRRIPAIFGNSETRTDAYEHLGIDEDG